MIIFKAAMYYYGTNMDSKDRKLKKQDTIGSVRLDPIKLFLQCSIITEMESSFTKCIGVWQI